MGSFALPLGGPIHRELEWAVAGRTCPGQTVSGDLYAFKPFADGVLVAVVDALGHGPEAEKTARLAAATLEEHAEEYAPDLVRRCHRVLRGTRGAVMSLASICWVDNTVTWLAIGDVEARLFPGPTTPPSSPRALVTRGGIVGAGVLPDVRPWVVPLTAGGDTLVLVTDGIRSNFAEAVSTAASPRQIADRILTDHQRGTDDALVLVARTPPAT